MIELKINPSDYGVMAFVAKKDLLEGKDRLYLGGPKKDREFFYPMWSDGVIPDVADIFVVHESVHIVIYKLTQSFKATEQFDNIDDHNTNFSISRS